MRCPSDARPGQSPIQTSYYDYVSGPSPLAPNPAGGIGCCYNLNFHVSHYNWANGFRKGFYGGPDDGNRSNSPFVMDCRDMGDGWDRSFFLDDPPTSWNYVTGYDGFYHAFRH